MTTEQRTISAEDRLSEHLPAISRPKAASCHRSQLFVDIFQLYWLQTIDITVVDVLASISERRTDVRSLKGFTHTGVIKPFFNL